MTRDARPRSEFFDHGFYKKARACPRPIFDGKLDVKVAIDDCKFTVDKSHPVIVEQKYNGNRGIFEYKDGKGCLFSGKRGCHDKGFPAKVARLIEHQFSVSNAATPDGLAEVVGIDDAIKLKDEFATRVDDVILDGEMYLENCNGKIPGIATQAKAIKGVHADLERDCIFSYKVFDIIKINGRDVTRLPLSKRKEMLSEVLPYTIMDSGKGISVEPVQGIVAASKKDISEIAGKLVDNGYEGIVVKSPGSKYSWKGRDARNPSMDGWWKLKNATSINASATMACLGNAGKTGLNTRRYISFQLSACKDASCVDVVPITTRGASHPHHGGDFDTIDKWNGNLHDGVVKLIDSGDARPVGIKKVGSLPRCVSIPPGKITMSVVGLEFNIGKDGIPRIAGPPLLDRHVKGNPSTLDEIRALPSAHV